ncbi:hypothetical protein [Streptomyces sp. NPDC048650]|uniref:hypothetical protein n=1 Tax=unclassified Streptomyces TaxID=2593676 RepID=UPI00371A7A7B
MRIRTTVVAVAVLAGLSGLAGCSQSYEDLTEDCLQALKDRDEGDKGKPDECEGVKTSDYLDLVMSVAIDDLGWTGEDGKFDKDKLLDDVIGGGN